MSRTPAKRPAAGVPGPPGQVRIIAGSLRGSRIAVPDAPGLRPTSDRVRETLFNWLQSQVVGARVLDLFAGVGALGFEAASRGAASVVLVERDPALARALEATAARLKIATAQVHGADALTWLSGAKGAGFDLVFVDPPFSADLWQATISTLEPCLANPARIYLESPAGRAPAVPANWSLLREGETRQVRYALYLAKA